MSVWRLPFFGQCPLQLLTRQAQPELASLCNGDGACLFRHDDGQAVAFLRQTQRSAVAQAQRFGDVGVVRYRQDAAGSLNAVVAYDHGSVMQGAVLEEDVFNQSLRDVGVDDVARADVLVQSHLALQYDEHAHLLLAHVDAGHYDGQDFGTLGLVFAAALEETRNDARVALRADGREKPAYFFLKQDYQGQTTHIDHLVENRTQQAHFKHLRHQNPYQDKHDDARKDVGRARLLHQFVDVVQNQRYQQDINGIFYSKVNHFS